MLNGGLLEGTVTELVGASASGKTQALLRTMACRPALSLGSGYDQVCLLWHGDAGAVTVHAEPLESWWCHLSSCACKQLQPLRTRGRRLWRTWTQQTPSLPKELPTCWVVDWERGRKLRYILGLSENHQRHCRGIVLRRKVSFLPSMLIRQLKFQDAQSELKKAMSNIHVYRVYSIYSLFNAVQELDTQLKRREQVFFERTCLDGYK